MNRDYCIFDSKKACDNCGDCEICELDSNKKCNNCGKCLEMEGYDMKAIKIDEIIDNESESADYENDKAEEEKGNTIDINDFHSHFVKDNKDDDVFDKTKIEYIDDIDGLSEVLKSEEDFKKVAHEEYPGLIRIKSRKDKNQSN